MNKGKIVQVLGPVVDVEFENNDLPFIKDALEVENNGKRLVMKLHNFFGFSAFCTSVNAVQHFYYTSFHSLLLHS